MARCVRFDVVPLRIVAFYIVFVALDLITTYLATPNLQFESNSIIKHFNLGWISIVMLAVVGVILMCLMLLCARLYFTGFFSKSQGSLSAISFKLILSFLSMVGFYFHFLYSIFLVFNNSMGYVYLNNFGGVFSIIAVRYINVVTLHRPYFYVIIQVAVLLASVFVVALSLLNVKERSIAKI